MATAWQDVGAAARSLRKAAGFTSLAIVVLAVGIGTTTIILGLIDSLLIRPLPFAEPGRLVMLWEHPPGYARNRVSPLNFLDWSDENHVFTSMAAVVGASRVLTGTTGAAERIPGQSVTTGFFDVLGIKPISGRAFTPDDAQPQPNVVIVSERFWQSHLGGEAAAIGRVVRLDGLPFTVIGVVPARFQILAPSDLWTPFTPRRTPEQRRAHYLQVIGRLRPERALEDARTDMGLVAENIARIAPETNRNWTVLVEPLRQVLVSGELRTTSLVLGGVVVFVLLMACANVANLLLARGVGRAREIAVRRAIGGSTAQIMRLLMMESVLLATIGGGAGLMVAWAALGAAPSVVPPGLLPDGIALTFNARVAGLAAVLVGLTGVLVGAIPASRFRPDHEHQSAVEPVPVANADARVLSSARIRSWRAARHASGRPRDRFAAPGLEHRTTIRDRR
jgi:predicted permease